MASACHPSGAVGFTQLQGPAWGSMERGLPGESKCSTSLASVEKSCKPLRTHVCNMCPDLTESCWVLHVEHSQVPLKLPAFVSKLTNNSFTFCYLEEKCRVDLVI